MLCLDGMLELHLVSLCFQVLCALFAITIYTFFLLETINFQEEKDYCLPYYKLKMKY